jgi:hypothetical protein
MIGVLIIKGLIFAAIVMSFQPRPKPTFPTAYHLEAIEHMNLDDEEDYTNDD